MSKVASNPLTSTLHLCMPEPWDWRHVATSSRRKRHPPPVKFTRAHFPRLHLIPTPYRGRVVTAVAVSSLFPRIERVYSRGDSSCKAPRAFPDSSPLSWRTGSIFHPTAMYFSLMGMLNNISITFMLRRGRFSDADTLREPTR